MAGAPLEGRVSLVIPTRNGGERFGRVLDMWRAQQDVGTLDIVCPDTDSRDGTLDRLRTGGARTMSIAPGLFNHGETRNRAVAATKTEFVILSVQDALPLSTTLAADLVAPLLADPSIGASYGRQQPRADCHPVLAARIGAWAGGDEPVVQGLDGRAWEELEPIERLQLVRYDHVIACMRRSAWERHRFEHASFGEDVRWSTRLIRSGGRIAFVPAALVEHSHDRSAWDEARRIYCDHRNLRELLGLVTVPHRRQIAANVEAARAAYASLVEARADVDATTRANWHSWAHELARLENWAQYLGANHGRRWWFRPVDRWLRRGI
ncbi:MAG: glycosyltransferase family 2 protein [Planctomycetota bacterium]|jgi:rhamnosyltransferase